MELKKDSTIEDISNFLKQKSIKEEIILKFKKEEIKGNELFFFEIQDYKEFGVKFPKKLINSLNEIKNKEINLLDFTENINDNSTQEEIINFLKKEITLNEETLSKFKEMNGKKMKNLEEKDLIDLGLKFGERKKLWKYIQSIKIEKELDVSNNSTEEEIYNFLKVKFDLPENILEKFKENKIDGNDFFEIQKNDLIETFEINDENKQNEIMEYIINKNKKNELNHSKEVINHSEEILNYSEESEEEITQTEIIFNHYQLIDVVDYITSEEEISKCPFNKLEDFIKLCEDMGIETEDNCSIIKFDQANNIKLKSVTLWGTKEGLFEFFENKKMKKTIEYFKNQDINKTGIFLLINKDNNLAYIIIWPGNLNYMYKKIDEPQKDILLSLVRNGFSLSNNNVICLSKKQHEEFDFQSIKKFNKEGIYKPIFEEVKFTEQTNDFFKIDKDIQIEYTKNERDGKLKYIKSNNSSIFLYFLTKENIQSKIYYNTSMEALNFKEENIIFDEQFSISPQKLFRLLKKFVNLKKVLKEKTNFYDFENIEKERINYINKNYLEFLTNYINKIKNYSYNCEICQGKEKLLIFSCSIHICFLKTNKIENFTVNNDRLNLKRSKNLSFINEMIKLNDNNLLNSFINDKIKKFNSYDFSKKGIYIQKLKELLKKVEDYINENMLYLLMMDKNLIIWKDNIIKEINKIFSFNYDKITKWIKLKKMIYNEEKEKHLFTFEKYTKYDSDIIIKLFTFYPYDNENKYLFKYNEKNLWKEKNFENYFINEKSSGLLIKKNNESNIEYEMKLKNGNIIFNGCYDYDSKNRVLILSKIVEKEIVNVCYLDEENKKINSRSFYFFDNDGYLTKIIIIPYKFEGESLYALFFTKNLISLINIHDFRKIIDKQIKSFYSDFKLNQVQILVYEKFLLFFYFNENKNDWNYDVYNISPNSELVFIKLNKDEENNNLNISNKNCTFSIFKIKDDIMLCYFYILKDELYIKCKKILCSISSFSFELISKEKKNNELLFTEGNCVFNYFYHSFIKYPSIGALQYNYQDIILNNIYIFVPNLKNGRNYKIYLEELKRICISERGLNYDDINYEFKGIFKNKKIKLSINLGDLMIKFIEVVPLQIAKIKNYFFKALSNGIDINKKDLYDTYVKKKKNDKVKISIQEYADYINFGMKNAIFNYYDLPVIVLVFMGSQSIGKSTLSNELVQSFFNVSGMRCTEGIWMAVSLFKSRNENNKKKCNDICKYCNNNKCRLLIHNIELICICENCCCDEICSLYIEDTNIKKNQNFCMKKCALQKGHEENHLCEISSYNHGFICVSLDFEGLGTFERSTEQDIDLAMVGAAIGNSIILRVDKTYDKFIQERMFNWSEGSKNIKTTHSKNFFGGNIIFCQKDVPKHNVDEVRIEFNKKINNSINKWIENEKKRNLRVLNNKFPIFGIFSNYVNAPTPIFNKNDFHYTLRKELIHLLVENVLIKKSLPLYRTGKEFMFFLQSILATVDIHDYNALDSIAIDNLKNYLLENKIKAFEIFGVYSITEEKNFNTFDEFENNLKSNLELLKSSYISNTKYEFEETLYIDINCNNLNEEKKEIKFNNLAIIIELLKKTNKEINDEQQSKTKILKIEGIEEFGLLLLIPSEYKEKYEIEDIRKKLFYIWETIGKKINLSIEEIINNFELFIDEIIKRREKNINNWLINLTSSFQEEEKIKSLKKLDISLKERWKICKEKCSSCYYKCSKIIGHLNEHDCGFDHKCHEQCEKCKLVKCEDYNNCDKFCYNQKSGHTQESHLCSHFHQCNKKCSQNNLRGCNNECKLEFDHQGNCDCHSIHLCDKFCIYKDCSIGCKIDCNLKINHDGEHKCESEEHKCILECNYKNKSIGCINEGICKYMLPHSTGNHNCGGEHLCNQNCYLKELSRNCKGTCILSYDHIGNHICGEIHLCKENCSLEGKSKGCLIQCCLKYGHEEQHDCKEKHYCILKCYFEDKSRNCMNNKNCNLLYNHEGKCLCGCNEHLCNKNCSKNECHNLCNLLSEHDGLCDCKGSHECKGICYLKKDSTENSCDNKCIYEIGHEGACKCKIPIDNHKCNKNCSSKDCNKNCRLIASHKGLCICGECNCKFNCDFQDFSRNCLKKCVDKYGHEGPHLCEEKNHLCNQYCKFKILTKEDNGGCFQYCNQPARHESLEHICGNTKDKHLCKGICSLYNNSKSETCTELCNKSIEHDSPCLCENSPEKHICNKECYLKGKRECKISCSLQPNHQNKCLCLIGENGHLCDKICTYFNGSRKGCNKICNLSYNHGELCICSSSIKMHICNKVCSLKLKSREGCSLECNLQVNHSGPCFCENSVKKHICNGKCTLKENSLEGSCNDKCNKNAGHDGPCICSSKRHECKYICYYKNNSRCGCLERCSKEAGHEDKHICSNELNKHKCKEICDLKNETRSGCNIYCDKFPGHEGSHLCNSNERHLCKKNCDLFNKCAKGCNQICSKITGHTDKHKCQSNSHICNGKCYLQNLSRECKIECILLYGHVSNCICSKKKEEHYCKEKCELCRGDVFCEYKYEHKIKNSNEYHLCKKEHDCQEKCNQNGYCEINTNIEFRQIKQFRLQSTNQYIEYEEESEQNIIKKKCNTKIPIGKKYHDNSHKCQTEIHKCGFKCLQCNRLCELEYGHNSLHYCLHGHIKNSLIQTEENNIKINYKNNEYIFQNEEEAIIFTCYQYCREQRRGHVHRIEKNKIQNLDENIRIGNIKKIDNIDNLYECKCEYFWEKVLQFRFKNEFESELKESFNKCPAKCHLCNENQITTYCELDLWHEPVNNNDIEENYWVSQEGHKFSCKHQIPCHTIFIIDKSGSMDEGDIKPRNEQIKVNHDFDNRLGCVIHVIDNYVKVRDRINQEDLFSFVAFNDEANIIFQEFNVNLNREINLISECMKKIFSASGGTNFKEGFIKANEILLNINRQKYKPVIILLSDGGDENNKETIEYVKNVSFLIILIIDNE